MSYSKPAYDVSLDKLGRVASLDLSVRFGFCPLGEIMYNKKHEFSLPSV